MLGVIYDLPEVSSMSDPTARKLHGFVETAIEYGSPGNYLVEYLTWMKHLPSVLAKWKRKAKAEFKGCSDMFLGLLRDVDNRIVLCCSVFLAHSNLCVRRTEGTNAQASLGL